MLDASHKNKLYVTYSVHAIIDCAYIIASAVVGGQLEYYKIDSDGKVGYIPKFVADYFFDDMANEKVTVVPDEVCEVIDASIMQVPKSPIPQKQDIDKILSMDFTLEEIKSLHEKYKGFGWYNDKYVVGFPIKRHNTTFYDCVLLRTPTGMFFIRFFNDELTTEQWRESDAIAFFERAFNSSLDMRSRYECFPD